MCAIPCNHCVRCGHCYHEPCLRAVGSIHVLDGEETFVCYLCSNAKRSGGRLTSTRFHRSLSNPSQQLHPAKHDGVQAKEVSVPAPHLASFHSLACLVARLSILLSPPLGAAAAPYVDYCATIMHCLAVSLHWPLQLMSEARREILQSKTGADESACIGLQELKKKDGASHC